MLHPFMPFVTEEIWQAMPTKDARFLMIASWPEP
jgi:valyl-tRNA synthetase